jgi:hypothetical protein
MKESFDEETDDLEDKETFLKKIFGEDLNLNEAGLSFQGKVQRVIESNYFHITVIILVLIDTAVVAAELITALQQSKDSNDPDQKDKDDTLELALKYTSISILGLFLIEICIKLIFHTHHFIKSKLEILDGVVVVISFVLDVVYFKEDVDIAFELITLLRLWRIARIVNGIH